MKVKSIFKSPYDKINTNIRLATRSFEAFGRAVSKAKESFDITSKNSRDWLKFVSKLNTFKWRKR